MEFGSLASDKNKKGTIEEKGEGMTINGPLIALMQLVTNKM